MNEVPINFVVLEVIRYLNRSSDIPDGEWYGIESSAGGCWKHGSDQKVFFCLRCKTFECRSCSVIEHAEPPMGACKIVSAKEGISIMKQVLHENISITANSILEITTNRNAIIDYIGNKINIEKRQLIWLKNQLELKDDLIISLENNKEEISKIADELQNQLNELVEKSKAIWSARSASEVAKASDRCRSDIVTINQIISNVQSKIRKTQPFTNRVSIFK